jgi:hypothetical protein
MHILVREERHRLRLRVVRATLKIDEAAAPPPHLPTADHPRLQHHLHPIRPQAHQFGLRPRDPDAFQPVHALHLRRVNPVAVAGQVGVVDDPGQQILGGPADPRLLQHLQRRRPEHLRRAALVDPLPLKPHRRERQLAGQHHREDDPVRGVRGLAVVLELLVDGLVWHLPVRARQPRQLGRRVAHPVVGELQLVDRLQVVVHRRDVPDRIHHVGARCSPAADSASEAPDRVRPSRAQRRQDRVGQFFAEGQRQVGVRRMAFAASIKVRFQPLMGRLGDQCARELHELPPRRGRAR